MKEYIERLITENRTLRTKLKKEGKTYRSRPMIHANGYLAALLDIKDILDRPAREEALRTGIGRLTKMLPQDEGK